MRKVANSCTKKEMNAMQTNPVKAIREKCLDCCCGSSKEVSACALEDCSLHPFRYGKNPYRAKREISEAQRVALLAHSRKKTVDNNGGITA